MADEIVDSCCLINLYATDDLVSLLSASDNMFHVPNIVVEESWYVLEANQDDPGKQTKVEIDLSGAMNAGVLQRCDLQGDTETELFVSFAAQADDGEAVCLAIAKNRGWSIANDDRKAQRLAAESGISVVTTPELVKHWADISSAADEAISAAVRRVRDCARFVPRAGSILHDWWMEKLEAAER